MQHNILRTLWKEILAIAIVGIVGITFLVPFILQKNTIKEASLTAVNTVQQYSALRRYYTQNIVSKLSDNKNVTISSDYKSKKNAIPLPATMIHELSALSKSSNLQINLYSDFPFPNRKNRKLNATERQAWKQLTLNPDKPYITTFTKGEEEFVRVALADMLTEQACVDCHNNHPLTPKSDWKLGDVRGVLEVVVPVTQQLSWQKNASYVLTIVVICIFLILFYFLLFLLSKESKRKVSSVLTPLKNQKLALNAHSLLSMADKQGNIIYVNDKFVEISGYQESELLGKKHNLLNSNHQSKGYWKNMHQTVLSGKIWHDEVRNRSKSGEYYWVDTTIVPNYDVNDEIVGFTSIRTDITQQIEDNENLATARDQAEISSRSKAEFLANMSHEIRTPMNGVIGMTNLLLGSGLNKDQTKLAKTVKASAVGLLSIINDILDFSKIEAGKLDLELVPFNLGQMIEDIGASMQYQSQVKNLQLICPANAVIQQWIKADAGRIRQILNNLIGNAIKFTSEGNICVYVKLLEQTSTEKTFLFEIKDTGIGIRPDSQSKLFKKFSQADGSTTRKYGGTGLGLSICKRLVEIMGGEIGIDSTLDKGSNFWFSARFLIAEQSIEQSIEQPIEQPIYNSDINNEKVLIVDDNEFNLALMDELLELWNIPHSLASNTEQALAELTLASQEKRPYSIAIIDIHSDDSLALCAQIQQSEQIAKLKIIVASSQAQLDDRLQMKDAGIDGFITKPIQQSELLDTLLMVSGLKQVNTELITRHSNKEHLYFNAHILVVEDNITNQLVIEGLLRGLGITVDLACNGKEAIEALQSGTNYDLVFMDCQMPVLDGYDATQRIRSIKSKAINNAIPIIAMTANAMAGDKQKCLDAGMSDYLSKPIESVTVIGMLLKWLPTQDKNKDEELANIQNIEVDIKVDKEESINQGLVVFDYDDMAQRLMNKPELIKSIADVFYEDLTAQIAELKMSLENKDTVLSTSLAHKIKGAASNVGGKVLSKLAFEMELAGKSGDLDMISNNVKQLEQAFYTLKAAMEKKLL